MPLDIPTPELAAAAIAKIRDILPVTLGTREIRERIAAGLLARSVFSARTANARYLTVMKELLDKLAAGEIGIAEVRVTLLEALRALGYTPEGGFPDDAPGEIPPALRGTLQDISSFRRLALIVKTQEVLMAGAGKKATGSTPDRLEASPCWELIRAVPVETPRNYTGREGEGSPRWTIAGGKTYGGRMIAPKGDPVWGELGASANFEDALDVDHPPFYFNSGMDWEEVPAEECEALGVTASDGTPLRDFLASRPRTLAGEQPLPSPRMSVRKVDPRILDALKGSTGAGENPRRPGMVDYSDLLERDLEQARRAYASR